MLFGDRYLTAMGWTLLQSVWQIALISGFLWAFLFFAPKKASQLRYAAAVSALVLMLVASGWTFLLQLSQAEHILPHSGWAPGVPGRTLAGPGAPVLGPDWVWKKAFSTLPWIAQVENFLPYLVNLWGLGAAFFLVRLSGSLYDLQKIHSKHRDSVSQALLQKVESLSAAMGIYRKVQVLKSGLVNSPVTYGFLKPVILLPASIAFSLTPAQLEAILAHELAHIRRNDYLINLCQSALEVIFFFHPCFWWISRRINEERENAADDLALAAGICPKDLAYGLAAIADNGDTAVPAMALASSGRDHTILRRIKRMLGRDTAKSPFPPLIPLILLIALVTLASLMVGAQDQRPEGRQPVPLAVMSKSIFPTPLQTIKEDTVPATEAPGMPSPELPPAPTWEELPAPPPPAMPGTFPDFPELDLGQQADSLARIASEMEELERNHSPEAREREKILQDALNKVQANIEHITSGFNKNVAQWHQKHGEHLKKYEEEIKAWASRWKEQQPSRETDFAPKMKEFEEKMRQWQLESKPKWEEFEEKMKNWEEEIVPALKELKKEMEIRWQEEKKALEQKESGPSSLLNFNRYLDKGKNAHC